MDSVKRAAALPVVPMAVSGANCALLEAGFALQAVREPGQRRKALLHAAATGAGLRCFTHSSFPFSHALWHLFAASAVGCVPL